MVNQATKLLDREAVNSQITIFGFAFTMVFVDIIDMQHFGLALKYSFGITNKMLCFALKYMLWK